jgi:hypothetical protein
VIQNTNRLAIHTITSKPWPIEGQERYLLPDKRKVYGNATSIETLYRSVIESEMRAFRSLQPFGEDSSLR